MSADFQAQVAAAAQTAQGVLGDSFTIEGDAKVYYGVFGAPEVIDIPNNGGGYIRQAQVTVYARRPQFAVQPSPKKKLTRTSGAAALFQINAVNIHDPYFYFFQLIKIGA